VSFLSLLGLGIALLVAAPYFAHRLRRRRAQEIAFPPALLVPPTQPQARRRSKLEDRGLLAVRAASVLALALLGATPFVRCSRLSLQRAGGASIAMAIVVDDSMSMRAPLRPGASRFQRAKQGARELLASAREGDAVAIVLAGSPARVALAATTDLSLARIAIDALGESDRGTDLEGALVLAQGLVSSLAQTDRRVVVLSDLADGHADDAPLGEPSSVPVWFALPELLGPAFDCAVLRADRKGVRVRVSYACGPGASMVGREVAVEDAAGKPLGRASPGSASSADATVLLPSDELAPARARLTGADAIASDDVAPVLSEIGRGAIAVVTDAATELAATGGAPVVEQALAALKLDIELHPLPAFPDRA
jgi:von Willebrand factor type A domain/Aerotolerance regulator N-terminal